MVPEGQEQPEDETGEQEIEKQPLELEDMLELFREPEEPPRKGFNPMWLVLALVVVVGGCWLAVTGVQAFVEQMTSLQGGTPKAGKSSERLPEAIVTDLQADYRARCAKGMTKDEIRWIVEDFRKARLDEGPGSLTAEIQSIFEASGGSEVWDAKDDEDPLPINPDQIAGLKAKALQLAKSQQDWYVDALADGLRLDAQQVTKARELGRKFISEKEGDFLKYEYALRSNSPEGGGVVRHSNAGGTSKGIHYIFPESGLLVPTYWLKDTRNTPWERFELRPEQLALTNQQQVNAQHGENAGNWLTIAATALAPTADELPFLRFWGEAICILPFSPEQLAPRDLEGDGTGKAMLEAMTQLNSAQVKLLLLCQPDLAGELMPLLEKE